MSEWGEIFLRNASGNFPPASPGGKAEWVMAQQRGYYLGRGDTSDMWGGVRDCYGGLPVGEKSTLMDSAHLSPCPVVLPVKSENIDGNYEQRCEENSSTKKLSLSG